MDSFGEQLRIVAVSGMAVEELGNDVWSDTAKLFHDHRGVGYEKLREMCTEMEAKFKQDFSITYMPSAYRSAKSVALAAVKTGVELVEEGAVRGKTEVELAIKLIRELDGVATGASATAVTPTNTIVKLIDKLHTAVVTKGSTKVPKESFIKLEEAFNKLDWER